MPYILLLLLWLLFGLVFSQWKKNNGITLKDIQNQLPQETLTEIQLEHFHKSLEKVRG